MGRPGRGQRAAEGRARVLLPTPPRLPSLSGKGFAVPTALTPPGRRSLRDAGCFWLQRVGVPAACTRLLLSLIPGPLSVHRLSSALLHGQCGQSPGLNHAPLKDLERRLIPGRPGCLGGSRSRRAHCAHNWPSQGPCCHLFTWREADQQKLSEPRNEPLSPASCPFQSCTPIDDGPRCRASARPHSVPA